VRDELTQFSNAVATSPRTKRGRWQARVGTLAGAAVLAGGIAAVSAPAAFASGTTTSTTTITSVFPPTPAAGHQFTVHVSVTGSSGTPTGSVTVSDQATPTAHTCIIHSLTGGTGSCQLTEPAGTYTLKASYAGDTTYAVSSGTRSVTVDASPQFTTDSPPLTATGGAPYSYTFVASGTPQPTYTLGRGAPRWLSIGSSSGLLTGTVPPGTTSFQYSVIASNRAGRATAGPFNVTVPRTPPARADLSVRLVCSGQVRLHKIGGCTLTVKNNGPAAATRVTTAISLPPGLGKVGCSAGCSGRGNVVTWNDGTLNNGASATHQVAFIARSPGAALVRGAADSAGRNPNPRGSQATAVVFVRR
jgi:hypothetical protein